jgi:error-prone DNA polymerase
VGGFVISESKVSDLVPIENASMENRTVIQWDKTDLESMRLLKVDVLALGMLTTLRKTLEYIHSYDASIQSLADIPREDPVTYDMLCKADTVGLFQVESRAQMAMLPRLQPRAFYDLVIQIAIVRPGPIQGDMVHPLLRRRTGQEAITYESEDIKSVLQPTMGVPIFQEQVMRLSIVAAGFTPGEADQLRRAMAAWGKNNKLLLFEEKFINGLLKNGYKLEFAKKLFEQIKGFGGYGFPESHSASFALLCYASAWLKCHHAAAFYCALLNSQPLGFYSPAQLIEDAKRHRITIFPLDINYSFYDYNLEKDIDNNWGIRIGFREVKSLNKYQAASIANWRGHQLFTSLEDIARRTQLSATDLQCLASADAFYSLVGNRHLSRWQAAAIEENKPLFDKVKSLPDDLFTEAPGIEKDVITDYQNLGFSLRQHPMQLLRQEYPFNRCSKCSDLSYLSHKGFVRIAGLVTCHQRPGTAKGTMFLTIEDETGNINVIVWKRTQDNFRKPLLTAKLLVIKGTLEIANEYVSEPVIHVVAGHLEDYSHRLDELDIKSRDFR